MTVEGQWNCVMKTRMGPQDSLLTITRNGDAFTGSFKGAMGSIDIFDGKIDGNTLNWTMAITKPMPVKMNGTATITGDVITGIVDGGMLVGKMQLTGTRKA